ncbi:MAG TPA: hypothetical protein VGM03_14975 [Phycisphaerae bacterium]
MKKIETNGMVGSDGVLSVQLPSEVTPGEHKVVLNVDEAPSPGKGHPPPDREEFWQALTIDALAAQQGVRAIGSPDEIIGQGSDLWEQDKEFEEFLAGIHERRRESATGT